MTRREKILKSILWEPQRNSLYGINHISLQSAQYITTRTGTARYSVWRFVAQKVKSNIRENIRASVQNKHYLK